VRMYLCMHVFATATWQQFQLKQNPIPNSSVALFALELCMHVGTSARARIIACRWPRMLDSTLVAFMGMFLSYAHAISVFDRLESTGTSATTQSKKCH